MESHGSDELEIIAQTRAAVADRLVTPWWYHPALGLLLALYTVGFSLGSTAVKFLSVALFGVGIAALVNAYRRLTGIWVNSVETGGRAGRSARILGSLIAVVLLVSASIGYWSDLVWPVVALALLLFAVTIVLGRRFDEALRADLRSDL